MRRRRLLLVLAIALASVPLAAAGYGYARFHLDYVAAIRTALRDTPRFTVDPQSLSELRFARVLWLGFLENAQARELSGLAPSRRRPDLLWGVNDSGGGPLLYAIGERGEDRGAVRVEGAINFDWEALDSFVLDGEPYLLIADVGDNLAWRPAVTLYIVREPVLDGERFAPGASVPTAYVLRARFADGPHDCEAVAVDARARRVLLLTKRAVPPVLYSLPLVLRRDDPRSLENLLVARRMTAVRGIPQPTPADLAADPEYGRYSSRPTALDIAEGGTRAVVFTYKEAYLFERRPGDGWAQAFARLPRRVRTPGVRAMEAGAFAHDGRALFMSSEFWPTPLYRFEP